MEKISKQSAHSKTVANILASLRIERLTPSDAVIRDLNACLAGQKTTSKVLQEVLNQHVTLRRV